MVAILGLGVVGLVMLIFGISRRLSGRPSAVFLIVGTLIALQAAVILVEIR